MSTNKFYIDTEGNDDQAYIESLRKASELSKKDGSIKRVVILIGTKSNTGWFERILGNEGVEGLFKGSLIKGLNPIFKFETKKTYKNTHSGSDVVIICGWESEEVFKIDDYSAAKYIIAIPWTRGGLIEWVKTWNATELRGKAEEVYADPSCIVVAGCLTQLLKS